MLQFLRGRRTGILLLAIVALLFTLMTIQVRRGGPTASEGALMRLAAPVARGFSGLTASITDLWGNYVDLRQTRERNAELHEELIRLQLRLRELEKARLENERLARLLDMKEGMGLSSIASRVIGNNSLGVTRTILIDRGSGRGVKANNAVVADRGVVGRVWKVEPLTSKIQLITDAAAGTAVLVQRSRVQGILLGRGADLCSLEYVSMLDDVEEGDLLVTSGLDGIYPKGLPVGIVQDVKPGPAGLRLIGVEPRVRFNRLEEVLILSGTDGGTVPGPVADAGREDLP